MNDTILRQWTMLRMIPRSPKKISTTLMLERLVREGFTASLRTVQRDLNTLSTIFPLVADDSRPQGWSWVSRDGEMDGASLEHASAFDLLLAQSRVEVEATKRRSRRSRR